MQGTINECVIIVFSLSRIVTTCGYIYILCVLYSQIVVYKDFYSDVLL